jgi:hypothetical protein
MIPTATQIGEAVTALGTSGTISTIGIMDAFAALLPAGYVMEIHAARQYVPMQWVIRGPAGSRWEKLEPVVRGHGKEIITRLVLSAWEHAESTGHDGSTVADQRAWVKAHPLPICPECGRTVLPHEAAVSSHPGHHRDCC